MLKHFGGFAVGIFVGVLVVAVALVGGGYMLLTKDGMMKTVEESVGSSVGMDLNEEQENLSLLDYGKGLLDIFGNLSTTPIKDIEGKVGINKISTTISDALGIEATVVGESSISDLGATITNNLTMDIMQEKFEIELPDLPLFQDEEFLAKPVSEAFGDLDENNLDCFIEVVYNEEATEENPASSALIQRLGKTSLKEISEDMDAIIQDTAIGDVIEIGKDSTEVLQYLKDTKIGELNGAIEDMTIGDAMTIHTEDDPEHGIKKSSKVLIFLKDTTLGGLDAKIKEMTIGDAVDNPDNNRVLNFLSTSTLEGLSAKINEMTIGDAVDIQEGVSHPVMVALADCTLEMLGDSAELQSRINSLKLGDVVEIKVDSARILQALKDTEIQNLSTKMNNLTLSEVLDKHNVGVLSLLAPDTKVQDIGPAASDAVTATSLYALCQAGVFSYTQSSSTSFSELVNKVNKNNGTPNEIIKDFTNNNGTPDNSITHSIYLYKNAIQNTAYNNTCKEILPGIARPGYEGEVDLEIIDGLEVNTITGAYVFTPDVIDAILAEAGIGSRHSVIFFVDQGIDIEIQAGETDGEYENYDKVFSIMYDANNATDQGTLYFGKGITNMTTVGGCAVYVADEIKVLDGEGNYVDYVVGEELPIARKEVSREVIEGGNTVLKTGYNTLIVAYNEYGV